MPPRSLAAFCTDPSVHPAGFDPAKTPCYHVPRDRKELRWQLHTYFGLSFPTVNVCPDHTAPFEALAEAYFAECDVSIWHASRGFGGKTTLLAALSLMETFAGYDVVLLGGSGEQSKRAYTVTNEAQDYTRSYRACPKCGLFNDWQATACIECDTSVVNAALVTVASPMMALPDKRMVTRTISFAYDDGKGTGGGAELNALTASPKSVRGPHPHRLRLDEVDEVDIKLIDAASGQTLTTDLSKKAQTVYASTHHYETGTMTEMLKRAHERKWPVRRWCYKETLIDEAAGRGPETGTWLPPSELTRKRKEVAGHMWRTEFDLEEPNEGGGVFGKNTVDKLFSTGGELIPDRHNRLYIIEEPEEGALYVTGADWGRKTDLTVIVTLRYDVEPVRLVAWATFYQMGWPYTIGHYNERAVQYPGKYIHDGTGLGDVVDGYLECAAHPYVMTGKNRPDLFLEYEHGVESGAMLFANIESAVAVHRSVQRNDLYGSGHPPDEIVALSLAWHVAKRKQKHIERMKARAEQKEAGTYKSPFRARSW
jgi:hypothetical protein